MGKTVILNFISEHLKSVVMQVVAAERKMKSAKITFHLLLCFYALFTHCQLIHCSLLENYSELLPCHWQIHMKTMPAAMYRLLTAQEQPIYIWRGNALFSHSGTNKPKPESYCPWLMDFSNGHSVLCRTDGHSIYPSVLNLCALKVPLASLQCPSPSLCF